MFSMKSYLSFVFWLLVIQLSLITSPNCLIAQTDFFPLGLWNYDICGTEHTVDEPNEMVRIDGLHGNYFTSMSLLAQPGNRGVGMKAISVFSKATLEFQLTL